MARCFIGAGKENSHLVPSKRFIEDILSNRFTGGLLKFDVGTHLEYIELLLEDPLRFRRSTRGIFFVLLVVLRTLVFKIILPNCGSVLNIFKDLNS
jgi:hypothetical protein